MILARSKSGKMIHRRDCRYAATGLPWAWAEERHPKEVQEAILNFGYQTCLVCVPLSYIAIRKVKE